VRDVTLRARGAQAVFRFATADEDGLEVRDAARAAQGGWREVAQRPITRETRGKGGGAAVASR
jgi:hypothetical protein